jgi:hypothetical protein
MALQELVVFKNEPVLNWLSGKRLFARDRKTAAIAVGIAFLLFMTLPLTAMAMLFDYFAVKIAVSGEYISYLKNFSWSVSMIFIYPLIVGLIYKYYLSIPRVLGNLLDSFAPDISKEAIKEYEKCLDKRFNHFYVPLVILVITLLGNICYFCQVIQESEFTQGWITFKYILPIVDNKGLTPAGLLAFFIQWFLLYFIFIFVSKTLLFIYTLYEFFSNSCFDVKLDPLHFDGVCGLRRIAKIDTQQAFILFLLGVYLSFKVIDKLIVQDQNLFSDVGNPILLGGFAFLAPFMFFLPLASAHIKMEQAKDRFLIPISDKISQLTREITDVQNNKDSTQYLSILKEIEGLHLLYQRKIPVWPFDLKSIQGFFGLVIMPLVPVLIPLVFDMFKT